MNVPSRRDDRNIGSGYPVESGNGRRPQRAWEADREVERPYDRPQRGQRRDGQGRVAGRRDGRGEGRRGVDTVSSMTYDRASHEETETDERLRSRTVIPKSANEPFGLRRTGVIRNRIFAAVAGVAIVAGLGAYAMIVVKPFKTDSPINTVSDTVGDKEIEKSTPDTVEEANKVIAAYYGYLANSDADGLRNIGNDAAANAVQNKWTVGIDYRVDNSVQPDAQAIPQPIGKYAGCKLYNISDFFLNPPANSVHSTVTGDTGYQGWVYYDPLDTKWVIVDPTIPTSVQVPESGHVARSSEDRKATVEISGPGAYSNPWWSYTMVSVDVTSSSADASISVKQRTLDSGITVSIPDTRNAGLSPIAAQDAQQAAGDANQNGDGASSEQSQSSAVAKASGICIIYRGSTSGFSPDRIGQQPLRIDGDITPITVSCGDEDITPIFAIGTSTATDIQKLLNDEQMSKYNVSSESVEKLEQEVKDMPQPDGGDSDENGNSEE